MDDMHVSDEFRSAVARMIRVKNADATDDEVDDQIRIIAKRSQEARARMGIVLTKDARRMQLRIIDSEGTGTGYDWLVWADKVH